MNEWTTSIINNIDSEEPSEGRNCRAESQGLALKSRSVWWPFWRTRLTNSWVGRGSAAVLRCIMADWTAPAGPGIRGVSEWRRLQGRRKPERSESSMSRASQGSNPTMLLLLLQPNHEPNRSRGKCVSMPFFFLFLVESPCLSVGLHCICMGYGPQPGPASLSSISTQRSACYLYPVFFIFFPFYIPYFYVFQSNT